MFEAYLAERKTSGLYRQLRLIRRRSGGPEIEVDGRPAINFSSNDYLGLGSSQELRSATAAAILRYGIGAGSSRLIAGNLEIHQQLEQELAAWKGTEAALLFNSGYQANVGIIPSIAESGDVILSDSLNHASTIDGCRLSRATTLVYRHADMEHLDHLLRTWGSQYRRRLIVSESTFSMDGDQIDVNELSFIARRYHALLMLDEAHSAGVLGDRGIGLGKQSKVDISLGTLGKAFAAAGAYVCGSRELIEYLINCCRSLIYSTAPDVAACAAALAALRIINAEQGETRREQLRENVRLFHDELRKLDLPVPRSHILPIRLRIGSKRRIMDIADHLLEAGIFAQGIRPPTVPPETSRLRFTVMATHTRAQIHRALRAIREIRTDLMGSPSVD